MTNLPTSPGSPGDLLAARGGGDLYGPRYGPRPPAKLQRAVGNAVHHEHGRAIVAAARVRGVHYVASTAARAIEDLTDMEALAISRNPLSEPRLRAINDTATAALAHIVAETGRP